MTTPVATNSNSSTTKMIHEPAPMRADIVVSFDVRSLLPARFITPTCSSTPTRSSAAVPATFLNDDIAWDAPLSLKPLLFTHQSRPNSELTFGMFSIIFARPNARGGTIRIEPMLFCDRVIPRSAASATSAYFAITLGIFLANPPSEGVILGLELIGTYDLVLGCW